MRESSAARVSDREELGVCEADRAVGDGDDGTLMFVTEILGSPSRKTVR